MLKVEEPIDDFLFLTREQVIATRPDYVNYELL
jgi:hypothetical protein